MVEGAALEKQCALTGTEGSNPSFSATKGLANAGLFLLPLTLVSRSGTALPTTASKNAGYWYTLWARPCAV